MAGGGKVAALQGLVEPTWTRRKKGGKASKAGLGMELEKWFSIFLNIVLASSNSGENSCRADS